MKRLVLMMIPALICGMRKNVTCVAILLILAGSFSSCQSKNEDDAGGPLLSGNRITAKVANASAYSNVVEVKLVVFIEGDPIPVVNGTYTPMLPIELSSGDWVDGGFVIELPETLAPGYLNAIFYDCIGPFVHGHLQPTITISNKNVKVSSAYFAGVDKDGNVVATFSPVRLDKDGNNVDEAFFTFVDSDVTISGYAKEEGHAHPAYEGAPSWFEITTNYSVEWEKGWNVWFFSRHHAVSGHTLITTEQWSITPVSGLKWYGSEKFVDMLNENLN
ncbi:MAG: hypothetical protein FWD09_09005 [Lentimicrobiaceae bacterium]|nr:hypothetical protein [Lentimicrobiaceae bacterium]